MLYKFFRKGYIVFKKSFKTLVQCQEGLFLFFKIQSFFLHLFWILFTSFFCTEAFDAKNHLKHLGNLEKFLEGLFARKEKGTAKERQIGRQR